MNKSIIKTSLKKIIENSPKEWHDLTTHRLDRYTEKKAKSDFTEALEELVKSKQITVDKLLLLPTAYDYIRLGHPLSCVLEWYIAKINGLQTENVIAFSSRIMPLMAVLRHNHLQKTNTRIVYTDNLPNFFEEQIVKDIYGYKFDLCKVKSFSNIQKFEGTQILLTQNQKIEEVNLPDHIDFYLNTLDGLGSIISIHNEQNTSYTKEIQHVRRRESIAMTPHDCLDALHRIVNKQPYTLLSSKPHYKKELLSYIKSITKSDNKPLIASSGLSMQYAIMMGLLHYCHENHRNKPIKILIPPNCYGGTNDQARRVAACFNHVEILDLLVDSEEDDMETSLEKMLESVSFIDALPIIIAEIPTNPRVEVPNLKNLQKILSKSRKTKHGRNALKPFFVLDQTFCPNVDFIGPNQLLSSVPTICYVSGSKFPSGGKCTAGYCVTNTKTKNLTSYIEKNLSLCDNKATNDQIEILTKQMPSMHQRIVTAYKNTRQFVKFIKKNLPTANINFVDDNLAKKGFTPSVFSLDLPTKGISIEEKEKHKRQLNDSLIFKMITKIPVECKNCVSYGQLKGSYWTIPATSTQGTTKEKDKDYIVRVSISPDINLGLHQEVFKEFVLEIGN